MSPAKKRAMIKRDHSELSISQQCKLVRLSRSAFYYTPVGIDADTLAMMKEIDRVFTKYPFFHCPAGDLHCKSAERGRQVAACLHRERIVVGPAPGPTVDGEAFRQIALQSPASQWMGLEAIYKRPRTSQPHPQHPVFPYLLRNMQIDRPNQVLLSPIAAQSSAGQWIRAASSRDRPGSRP